MPITQKDIAREVGVSQTVVSDVLLGRPRGRVRPEVRERILETARRLAYHPNASARRLRSRESRQVAYLATWAEVEQWNALGEPIVGGLSEALADEDYLLVIRIAPSARDEPRLLNEMLAAGVCDGAVVRALDVNAEVVSELRALRRPVVIIGQCSDPGVTSVAHDAAGMVRRIAEGLVDRGHRRVGLIGRPRRNDYDRLLLRAWEQITQELGLMASPRLGDAEDRSTAERIAEDWLADSEGPTAIVCRTEPAGLAVTHVARRRGLLIGANFDLVVFTTEAHVWLFEPGTLYLTTTPQEIGRRAARELLDQLSGQPPSGPVRLLPELRTI